ncbi:MAG TPA: PIG-L family deacetylase, partial [Anaeromyxobacteraceae bacterium]|nr:PIG-L family deacetylase [Anaeromyxobacteraceae bacterium]
MSRPCVIVAAHPDDEAVGAASLLLRIPGAAVVFLTDGAPRDPGLRSGPRTSREAYAEARHAEAGAALAVAGLGAGDAVFLGGDDQDAIGALAPLAEELARVLATLAPRLLVAHAFEGGHPDHDAAALAVRAARALLARRGIALPHPTEMTSYHLLEGDFVTGEFLPGPPALTVTLDADEQDAKRRMLAAYASQREVLEPFGVEAERFRRGPRITLDD